MVNLSLNRDIDAVTIVLKWLSIVMVILFGFYLVLVHLNTNFVHGYLFIEAGLPGPFISRRYTFYYILLVIGTARYLVPITCLFMLADRRGLWRKDLHRILTRAIVIADFVIGAVLLWYKCSCNAAIYPSNPCNDLRWCCVNFAANPDFCPNTAGCTPAVSEGDLSPNTTFIISLILSGVFLVLDFWQLALNRLYRKYLRNSLSFDDAGIGNDVTSFYNNLGWREKCKRCKNGFIYPNQACSNCKTALGRNNSESYISKGWMLRCNCKKKLTPKHLGRLHRNVINGTVTSSQPEKAAQPNGLYLRCTGCGVYHNDRQQRWEFRESGSYKMD